jgi:hypothetical protein
LNEEFGQIAIRVDALEKKVMTADEQKAAWKDIRDNARNWVIGLMAVASTIVTVLEYIFHTF